MRRTPDDTLTTTEAARILHCSRQHVAALVDNGTIPGQRVGNHRRILRTDLDRYLHPAPRREDEQSLWLNHAYVAKLLLDPDGIIEQAKLRLEWLRGTHGKTSSNLFDQWQRILDEGVDSIIATMTERSETANTLRSASPFSGLKLLDDHERLRIRSQFRKHWESTHTPGAA